MANKAKNYFVRFLVPDTQYEFAGNDRNATFAPSESGSKIVTAYATNSDALNAPILLPLQGEFKIKRVRLRRSRMFEAWHGLALSCRKNRDRMRD